MFLNIIEFIVVGVFSISMFGFNTNAQIAIGLYYARKVILFVVRNNFV